MRILLKETRPYRYLRNFALILLYRLPFTKQWAYKRLPRHRVDYTVFWGNAGTSLQHLKPGGIQEKLPRKYIAPPLTFFASLLDRYHAHTVLDAGCGTGRQMKELVQYAKYQVTGFDFVQEYVDEGRRQSLDMFQLDIVNADDEWIENNRNKWDVTYAMLVMCFFIDKPEQMKKAMYVLDQITKTKVLIWEWEHVCDYMRHVYPSSKFEYRNLPLAL